MVPHESRKEHSATKTTLNKWLNADLIQISHSTTTVGEHVAHYYDNISHFFTILKCLCLGILSATYCYV